jgi:hypothetical protein
MKKNEPPKDPFLEDEGFLPSDISGATTPRKVSSAVLNSKGTDRRDSHKISNVSQEEYTGIPKRTNSIVDMKKQTLSSQNIFPFRSQAKEDHQEKDLSLNKEADSQNKNTDLKQPEVKVNTTSIFSKFKSAESGKEELKEEQKEPAKLLFSKPFESKQDIKEPDQTPKVTLFETKKTNDGQNKAEDKTEKPKLKSIFGPSQNIIEELKQWRSSNNSSPSFGESKNVADDKASNKPAQSKITSSIFAQKPQVIVESPNEEEQANQEDLNKSKNIIGTLPVKVPEVFPTSFTKLQPAKPVESNPFLNQGTKSPLNLFSKETKQVSSVKASSEKPVSSEPAMMLFGYKPESSFNKPTQQVQSKPANLFGASNNDQEDVGMGGTTPPNQSPIATSAPKAFIFNKDQPKSVFSLQGSSGSSKPSATPSATGSIFGKSSSNPVVPSQPTSIFSMGKSSNEASKSIFGQNQNTSQSGSLFMSAPSQGQPDANKTLSWNVNPFPTAKVKTNDNLFSDK